MKELKAFDEFAQQQKEFDKKYKGVVYNLANPKEEKQARSDKFAIGKILSLIHI